MLRRRAEILNTLEQMVDSLYELGHDDAQYFEEIIGEIFSIRSLNLLVSDSIFDPMSNFNFFQNFKRPFTPYLGSFRANHSGYLSYKNSSTSHFSKSKKTKCVCFASGK